MTASPGGCQHQKNGFAGAVGGTEPGEVPDSGQRTAGGDRGDSGNGPEGVAGLRASAQRTVEVSGEEAEPAIGRSRDKIPGSASPPEIAVRYGYASQIWLI